MRQKESRACFMLRVAMNPEAAPCPRPEHRVPPANREAACAHVIGVQCAALIGWRRGARALGVARHLHGGLFPLQQSNHVGMRALASTLASCPNT